MTTTHSFSHSFAAQKKPFAIDIFFPLRRVQLKVKVQLNKKWKKD